MFISSGGNLNGIVANVLDCDTVMCKFKLQSCYIPFRINTLGKGTNPFIPPAIS